MSTRNCTRPGEIRFAIDKDLNITEFRFVRRSGSWCYWTTPDGREHRSNGENMLFHTELDALDFEFRAHCWRYHDLHIDPQHRPSSEARRASLAVMREIINRLESLGCRIPPAPFAAAAPPR